MNDKNTNFEIIQSDDPKPAFAAGHGTQVRRFQTLSGLDAVEKTLNPYGDFEGRPKQWHKSSLAAKEVSDRIRLKNNPAYSIPKTFISHKKVYEQFAGSNTVFDIYEHDQKYLEQTAPKLVAAIGNFINDMSELEPVKKRKPIDFIPGINLQNGEEFDAFLSNFNGIISDKNIKTIKSVFAYIVGLPEMNELVMAHQDLNMSNILIDKDTEKISIIDFETTGYISKFSLMYYEMPRPDLWNYINHLPRTKNPNLRWDYDENKSNLLGFIHQTIKEMRIFLKWPEKSKHDDFVAAIDKACTKAEFFLGQSRLNDKRISDSYHQSAIVAARHYGKE